MKSRFSLSLTLALTLVLAACVDTTGISPESSRPSLGNPDAAVVVAEFADIQCPACRSAHTTITLPLVEQYGSQIRFDFFHFPLRSLHRYALDLAEAAECSADQGKFWEFVDYAYERQDDLKRGVIATWAENLKLDMDLYSRCTRSHIKRDMILAEYEQGKAVGVTGTPTYFVNGQRVDSSIEAIRAAIEQELKGGMQKL